MSHQGLTMITTGPLAKMKAHATRTQDYGCPNQEALLFTYFKRDSLNNHKMCFYVKL